jgi:hypothetical protein
MPSRFIVRFDRTAAGLIHTCDFTVKDSAFDVKMRGDPCGEIRKTGKMFLFSRD